MGARLCHACHRHDPHLVWLKEVDFVPLTSPGDCLGPIEHRAKAFSLCWVTSPPISALSHTVVLAAIGGNGFTMGDLGAATSACFVAGMVASAKIGPQCIAFGSYLDHPIGSRSGSASRRLDFPVYIEYDWGISLFFLTPLRWVAIPPSVAPSDGIALVSYCWHLALLYARGGWPPRLTSPRKGWPLIQTSLALLRVAPICPRADPSWHSVSTRDGPSSPAPTEVAADNVL